MRARRPTLFGLLVALVVPCDRAGAQSADDTRLGHYTIVDDATGQTLCALDLLFEPTIWRSPRRTAPDKRPEAA